MLFEQRKSGLHSRRSTWTVGKSAGLGAAAGAVAAAAALLGPKAVTKARAGKGHPLKHRVLDLASGAIQRKYPVEAISTYLNGFHMYADDMGRQVEASHFCIHLRHDLHQCVIFDRNAPGARLIGRRPGVAVTLAGRAERARVARASAAGVPDPGYQCGDDAALVGSELSGTKRAVLPAGRCGRDGRGGSTGRGRRVPGRGLQPRCERRGALRLAAAWRTDHDLVRAIA